MNDDDPLDRMCKLCRAAAGEECFWRFGQRQRFHRCRLLKQVVQNMGPAYRQGPGPTRAKRPPRVKPVVTPKATTTDPLDSEEWRRGHHLALHKLKREHNCAGYPPLKQSVHRSI